MVVGNHDTGLQGVCTGVNTSGNHDNNHASQNGKAVIGSKQQEGVQESV